MYNLKFDDVAIEIKDRVATISINREDKLNALNSSVLEHLYCYLSEVEKDMNVGVVVITGTGNKAFAAGADLSEAGAKEGIVQLRDYYGKFDMVYDKIASIPQPVVARVNGYALGGGCLLALSCDMIVATEKAIFSQPEVSFGFIGGATLLPRLVGKHIAAEITLLGETFSAGDGYRWNLINRITAEGELDRETDKICKTLLKKSPMALSMIKRCIKNSLDTGLTTGNKLETELAAICLSTQESKDKITKFSKHAGNKTN